MALNSLFCFEVEPQIDQDGLELIGQWSLSKMTSNFCSFCFLLPCGLHHPMWFYTVLGLVS